MWAYDKLAGGESRHATFLRRSILDSVGRLPLFLLPIHEQGKKSICSGFSAVQHEKFRKNKAL